ncbi:MAG: bacteriohopanetetrol glucosamine biosynthesis glycosyltransferase HpnI [Terriglobales bacterium]
MIAYALLALALIGTLASTVFLWLVLLAARRFQLECKKAESAGAPVPRAGAARPGTSDLPPVTLLKPVHGMEPMLEESLESFFRADYPQFEIIFGARQADDAALQVVEQLRQRYPSVKVKVVLSGEPPWPNAKVYSLEKMVAAAAHDYFIISDSDVRVEPGYIHDVVRPLLDPQNGMVTCVYRGVATGGLWSRLEALGMSVEFASGVVTADMLEGMRFALGPTMAIRRDVLERVGGVAVLADYCADDYVLGSLTHQAGYKVVLSHHVIDHIVLGRSAGESLSHQVRWMKSTRYSRPKGHVGTGLTFATPYGLLGLAAGFLLGNPALGFGLLAWALVNRWTQALAVGVGVARDRAVLRWFWLYPVRDLLGFLVWCASFMGSGIQWRGERYRLLPGGKMVKSA